MVLLWLSICHIGLGAHLGLTQLWVVQDGRLLEHLIFDVNLILDRKKTTVISWSFHIRNFNFINVFNQSASLPEIVMIRLWVVHIKLYQRLTLVEYLARIGDVHGLVVDLSYLSVWWQVESETAWVFPEESIVTLVDFILSLILHLDGLE